MSEGMRVDHAPALPAARFADQPPATGDGRVASFDVFDTVLLRLVGSPAQVAVETGRRLRARGVVDLDPQAYAATRGHALAGLTTDVAHHPGLDTVARETAARLGLPADAAAVLAEVECAVERDVCRAVPGAVARVAAARARTGRGVVFVSDTPLPESFVAELLAAAGLLQDGDRVYASATRGASKQHGDLYDVVAADLALPPSAFDHVGDDRWSDLVHARGHGWSATLDRAAVLTARERALDERGPETGGVGPRLAAAARGARLSAAPGDGGVAAVGGAVAAPLLVGFGLWVLQQARALGLDRLHFVARDGEVFQAVTTRLAREPLDARYLYGSRSAWQLAAASGRGPWVPDEADPATLTARAALALVGLTPADADVTAADAPLGARGWAALQDRLAAGPLADLVAGRRAERRDLLVAYLDQEGVTAPGRVGIVDVGWSGRAARALEDVLAETGRPAPAAYLYLGLRADAPATMGPELYARSHGWLLDEARGRRMPPGPEDPVMLVESFAMGREGHTTGYARADGRVVPVLDAPRNPAAAAWAYEAYRRSLDTALDALLDGPPLPGGVDLRPLATDRLLAFWRRPEPAEARAWGAQPYGEDFANETVHPLATPLTAARVAARLRGRTVEPTYWRAGTMAVSGAPWRLAAGAAGGAARTLARSRRVPGRVRAELTVRRRPR